MADPSLDQGRQGRRQLEALFARTHSEGRAALLPYMIAGLPDATSSVDLFVAMADAGADGFEVGIPYSDPLMDGPTIQRAGARALAAGTTIEVAFDIVRAVALRTSLPVIVMTYVNPILRVGPDVFAAMASDAGASGLIVADLPAEESETIQRACDKQGIGMVLFVAPTTDDGRLAAVAAANPVFLYGIAEMGVTGERTEASSSAASLAKRVRAVTDVPLVMGVGISTPPQAAAAGEYADGVIVGSALVRRVLEATSPEDAAKALHEAVSALVEAIS